MQEGLQEHDERQVERMKRQPPSPQPTPAEIEQRFRELGLVWKPFVPKLPKQRRRRIAK